MSWIKIKSQKDVVIYTILTTLLSMTLSFVIVIPALSWLEPSALETPVTYLMALLAPLLVAPFVTGYTYQTVFRLEQTKEQLEIMSRTDALTKLYNRGFFWEHVSQELQSAKNHKQPVALIIFDIDNFKAFNDAYGHLVGDSVLQLCAQTAANCLRKGDYIARFGGEEFAVFLNDCGVEQANDVAERIRQTIAQAYLVYQENQLNITVSLGLATSHLTYHLDELAKKADDAMYQAKRQGKNRIVTVNI